MLKAMVKSESGRKILVLGLSQENIRRLQAGRPITIDDLVERIGMEVFIFTGDTEQSMAHDLKEMIGPDTETRIDPRLIPEGE